MGNKGTCYGEEFGQLSQVIKFVFLLFSNTKSLQSVSVS